jgi:hypothetical protein
MGALAICAPAAHHCASSIATHRRLVIAEPNADGSFDEFMTSLHLADNRAPSVSARRFGETLHIDLQTLARQAHVPRNPLSRGPVSQSVQRLLRDVRRVRPARLRGRRASHNLSPVFVSKTRMM